MSNRLDQEREKELQPKRIEHAIQEIEKLGVPVQYQDETKIQFIFKRYLVTFFPYSGWHSGKSIKDGRSLQNLLNQLKK